VRRKLALDLLDIPFECFDSLVCLDGELFSRLQKQLAKLLLVQVELLYRIKFSSSSRIAALRHTPVYFNWLLKS
jgi:hypothetical protein